MAYTNNIQFPAHHLYFYCKHAAKPEYVIDRMSMEHCEAGFTKSSFML